MAATSRVRRGFARTAAIGIVALWLAAGCADDGPDVFDGGASTPDDRLVDLIVAPAPTVFALSDERTAAAADTFGVQTDVGLGEARAQTDDALAELEEAVDEAGDRGSAYGSTFDALGQLEQVRAEVDAGSGTIDVGDIEAIRAIDAAYGEITNAVLEAAEATARDVDGPQLRRGADLYTAGLREFAQEQELVRYLLLETVGDGLSDSASVAEVSRLRDQVVSGQATVMDLAAGGDYAEIAEPLRTELADADLAGLAGRTLETGVVDIAALTSAMTTKPDAGWPGFLVRLEDALRQPADD